MRPDAWKPIAIFLEDAKDIEKTIYKVRGMAGGLSETQKTQFQGVIDLLLQFEQDFHTVLKIQRSTLELIQQTYQAMTKDGAKTIADEIKTRMQTLSKEYSTVLVKLGNDAEAFQGSAAEQSKPVSSNWGGVVVKVLVGIFSILGAVFIAVISAVAKSNQKR